MIKLIDKICRHFGYIKPEDANQFTGLPFYRAVIPGQNHEEVAQELEELNMYPVIVRKLIGLKHLKSRRDMVLGTPKSFNSFFELVEQCAKSKCEETGAEYVANANTYLVYRPWSKVKALTV